VISDNSIHALIAGYEAPDRRVSEFRPTCRILWMAEAAISGTLRKCDAAGLVCHGGTGVQ
jgi:hypothetical protein